MKKTFLLAALLCSFFPEIGASGIPVTDESTIVQQNRKVEGIIVDEAGEPVIGVNVRVKGNSTLGTITDYDGKFSNYITCRYTFRCIRTFSLNGGAENAELS